MYKLIYELIDKLTYELFYKLKLTYELIYKLICKLLLHSPAHPAHPHSRWPITIVPWGNRGLKNNSYPKKVIFNFGTPPLFCWTLYVLTLVFVWQTSSNLSPSQAACWWVWSVSESWANGSCLTIWYCAGQQVNTYSTNNHSLATPTRLDTPTVILTAYITNNSTPLALLQTCVTHYSLSDGLYSLLTVLRFCVTILYMCR